MSHWRAQIRATPNQRMQRTVQQRRFAPLYSGR